MSGEFNFEVMPFEAYDGFRTLASEQSGFEMEEEFGRRGSRVRRVFPRAPRVMSGRSARPSIFPFKGSKKPPVRKPRLTLPRWPWGVAVEPYGVAVAPYPAEPPPAGSEYMRWVQSALNDVLGLRLPLDGIADSATRSAIRSFQRREGLPVDGAVGPDTERALISARGGASPRDGAPTPTGPGMPEPVEQINAPQAAGATGPSEPTATLPAAEFEWGGFEQELDATREIAERAHTLAPPTSRIRISEREVRATLAMAATKVPGLGITIEELLVRHQAEARGIPIEVLLAFIHFEAGRLFDDATAGKWSEKHQKYIPSFYELGVFQTPAGDHGCTNEAGVKTCMFRPPGRNVENSPFGKGWRHLAGVYPTESNWRDPTMQVRVGLWDLNSAADRVHAAFAALFPSRRSEWFLRMAVLYSFAAGAGAARFFLRKFKNELLALPEAQRWDFLCGKNVGTFHFNPENIDKKMALAAKLRAVRGTAIAQTPGGTR
ncbi:hypothetical protein AC629_19855 [Bradyrhizobium sp. NAS80.1]|nr:hypothetical protein AC629_19855 [Bradyrhizobium sp. NAS80.1]